jgi:hypothetical protein
MSVLFYSYLKEHDEHVYHKFKRKYFLSVVDLHSTKEHDKRASRT